MEYVDKAKQMPSQVLTEAQVAISNLMTKKEPDPEMKFDLRNLGLAFQRCQLEDGQIALGPYLEGYSELLKFFPIMGNVFHIVKIDVKSKIDNITKMKDEAGDKTERYGTVRTMIEGESADGVLKVHDKTDGSATRSLLGLNRSLSTVIMVFERLGKAGPEDKVSTIATECYNQSMAQYHGWLTQQGMKVALFSLPSRRELFTRVLPYDDTVPGDRILQDVADCINCVKPVHDRLNEIFREYNLLNLR